MKKATIPNKMTSTHPQRRYRREGFERLVGVTHKGRPGFEASLEISEGGMLLAVDRHMKVGDRLEIGLFIDGQHVQTVHGVVAYQSADSSDGDSICVGVRFVQPSARLQSDIREYVEKTGQKTNQKNAA